jgi:hypothetical protein
MQKPFPELTFLWLYSRKVVTVVPDSFLGGSAPRLLVLRLHGMSSPGLPTLLLPFTHLLILHLSNIPHSGYFSPEAIVNAVSTLTGLHMLGLEFLSPHSFPDGETRHLPPLTRSALPALGQLCFKGASEYLEDLVARIDIPQLDSLNITLFNQIVFHTPQLIHFITRTPTLKAPEKACLDFDFDIAGVTLSSPNRPGHGMLNVKILCSELDWQVSSLEQVCTSCLPPLSALEDLYIYEESPMTTLDWRSRNTENTLWLELLQPFPAVKSLYLSEDFAPLVARALQELVGGRTLEVLLTLQNIFLDDLELVEPLPVPEGIAKFVAARQLSGHPITISLWERYGDPDEYGVGGR